MQAEALARRLQQLASRGVSLIDPRQTYVADDVRLERVRPGATLHPGTRLHGPRTYIGEGAEIGAEGPATVRDSVIAGGASIASGFVSGAVLLPGASVGFGGHIRPGTLMEEGASTAHCVGLKQTILLSFVTLGSLINFCDCLMAGGTSRQDHSEVGSGFIHFNFTPWGARGDKATPSLIGDVPRGVFLRERRIFLGGSSGLVGPGRVGYGAVSGAGQVVRKAVGEGRLSVQPARAVDVERAPDRLGDPEPRASKNIEYIGNLVALRAWYRDVRLVRATEDEERIVVEAALDALCLCIDERVKRLEGFLGERGVAAPKLQLDPEISCPLAPVPSALGHVEWVQSLDAQDVADGVAWLAEIVSAVSRCERP